MSISDILYTASHVSAYLGAIVTGILGYGFLRLSCRHSGVVGHLATGLLLMHVAVFLRTLYWDGLRNLLSAEIWARWYDLTGGTTVNLFFNLMVVGAGYHSLRALQLSIPEEVRGEYSLIGAAFYPRLRVLELLRDTLVAWWRRIRG